MPTVHSWCFFFSSSFWGVVAPSAISIGMIREQKKILVSFSFFFRQTVCPMLVNIISYSKCLVSAELRMWNPSSFIFWQSFWPVRGLAACPDILSQLRQTCPQHEHFFWVKRLLPFDKITFIWWNVSADKISLFFFSLLKIVLGKRGVTIFSARFHFYFSRQTSRCRSAARVLQ